VSASHGREMDVVVVAMCEEMSLWMCGRRVNVAGGSLTSQPCANTARGGCFLACTCTASRIARERSFKV
jgi:hypothetical protein